MPSALTIFGTIKFYRSTVIERFLIIKKEADLDQFDDEEDIFQMKTFEYNFSWTWDVQNETCAICRSSLMELSPNISVSLILKSGL